MRGSHLWYVARLAAVIGYVCIELLLGFQDTPINDEARHLRDGATILAAGRIDVNPEHPPLVKILSALALPRAERRAALGRATGGPMTADARFAVSLHLVGKRLLRARLPAIFLAGLGLLAFGSLFSRRSPPAALMATLGLGGVTPFLAHGHYVATDIAPVVFVVLTVWALVSIGRPWAPVCAGLFLGLSLVTKFSAPLLFPFLILFTYFRLRWRGVVEVVLVSFVVVFGVEAYATRGMVAGDVYSLAEQAFVGGGLGGPAPPSPALLRASEHLIAVSPSLGGYWIGFWDVARRSTGSEWADYWMGKIVAGPQPLYPVATLAFKDDLPFLLLAFLGALVALSARRWRLHRDAWIAVAGGLFYLGLACRSSLHLGVRHLLPVVALLAVVGPLGAIHAKGKVRALLWVLVAAHLVVAAADFPHYVSARNVASRLFLPKGVSYDISDDWGQDLGRALKRCNQPVEYAALFNYRVPDWQPLFPSLRLTPCPGCHLFLVDQITLDLMRASTAPDIPPAGRQSLAKFQGLFERVTAIRKRTEPLPIGQPTLRLFTVPGTTLREAVLPRAPLGCRPPPGVRLTRGLELLAGPEPALLGSARFALGETNRSAGNAAGGAS